MHTFTDGLKFKKELIDLKRKLLYMNFESLNCSVENVQFSQSNIPRFATGRQYYEGRKKKKESICFRKHLFYYVYLAVMIKDLKLKLLLKDVYFIN